MSCPLHRALQLPDLLVRPVSSVTFLRNIFPESAFGDRAVEDVNLKILRDNAPSDEPCQLVHWLARNHGCKVVSLSPVATDLLHYAIACCAVACRSLLIQHGLLQDQSSFACAGEALC